MESEQFITALQTVLSPVILISGVGLLVLSMTNRFSHTTDRARLLRSQQSGLEGTARHRAESQIRILHRRLKIQLLAITLALGSVLLIALLIVSLFVGYLFGMTMRGVMVILFSLSLISLVVSLVLFIRDMSLSLKALQEELEGML